MVPGLKKITSLKFFFLLEKRDSFGALKVHGNFLSFRANYWGRHFQFQKQLND